MPHFGTEQERRDYFAKFEKYGESEVRIQINKGIWHQQNRIMLGYAQEWLRLKDEDRALEASSKRDAREEETLKIAKEALDIAKSQASTAALAATSAREQARWAKWAAIIATAALAITNHEAIISNVSQLIQ